jgi:hypothetical protein
MIRDKSPDQLKDGTGWPLGMDPEAGAPFTYLLVSDSIGGTPIRPMHRSSSSNSCGMTAFRIRTLLWRQRSEYASCLAVPLHGEKISDERHWRGRCICHRIHESSERDRLDYLVLVK